MVPDRHRAQPCRRRPEEPWPRLTCAVESPVHSATWCSPKRSPKTDSGDRASGLLTRPPTHSSAATAIHASTSTK